MNLNDNAIHRTPCKLNFVAIYVLNRTFYCDGENFVALRILAKKERPCGSKNLMNRFPRTLKIRNVIVQVDEF